MKSDSQKFFLPLALIITLGCGARERSSFEFKESAQGVELLERGKPVFFYQREPKSRDGQYICTNYVHPLYSITGDTLTEEFPADHLYHRGIFWAWHQLYIGNKSVGDGWVMENISQDVAKVRYDMQGSFARLVTDVYWKSQVWKNNSPFVHEHTTILVHPQSDVRILDFEIALRALVPDVSIGGSDDEKGYGGFCVRIKLPGDLTFTSEQGPVIPQTLQIVAGPWMDFSASFGENGQKSGLTILCHTDTPNYPAPWILRQATSMQNVVFPGRERIALPVDKSVVLKYRLIVHNGIAGDLDLARLQEEYREQKE